jgi:hypothetical protein
VGPQMPGATVTFTATAAGGTAPYQFKWWLGTVRLGPCCRAGPPATPSPGHRARPTRTSPSGSGPVALAIPPTSPTATPPTPAHTEACPSRSTRAVQILALRHSILRAPPDISFGRSCARRFPEDDQLMIGKSGFWLKPSRTSVRSKRSADTKTTILLTFANTRTVAWILLLARSGGLRALRLGRPSELFSMRCHKT